MEFSQGKLKKIVKKYQLLEVYLFGSKISGFSREDSDLDVAVRFQRGLPLIEKRAKVYGNLFSDLSSCFSEQKIDLVFIEEVPLHFQFKIVAQGELIFTTNQDNSFSFREKVVNLYRDYKYFIDEFFEGTLVSLDMGR
ncbi:hypothetical protein COX24_00665 [bacterium (Candidatus Gribaldobacteria) CG23_combo_of_CG06-09_8_20_14_all_37_87_8]|uniref:Polymerase beta nucleotidyltransferase domain-containing protein n=1 Tax=bacterium (Candidatus Gribaldobacteria) CG23_combo_of_CG06-09_8_20_14_all_37_87_8 TaxID=2014278 RepID=A0A2G9ZFL9_9BACT|nr:MAG: hypothetical protein COX24_00665 [bacterium (Candidatus Gribaldobacteria) CG23_combo_of_CG06-09_8_20_14_all_37_87_8]